MKNLEEKIKDKIVIFEIGVGSCHSCRTQNTMGHENVELHLIEAHPHTYKDLVNSYGSYKNVNIYNYAVADYTGEIEFVFDGDSSYIKGVNSPTEQCAYEEYKNNLHIEKVPCIKISDLDKGNIDELLLDMEGSEIYVLKHLISRPSKIFIELNAEVYKNPNYDEIFKWMDENGYILLERSGDDGIFIKDER